MNVTPIMRAARSRAARMRLPGAYVFSPEQPPVLRLAGNGHDVIVDVEATEALYAEDISGGK